MSTAVLNNGGFSVKKTTSREFLIMHGLVKFQHTGQGMTLEGYRLEGQKIYKELKHLLK